MTKKIRTLKLGKVLLVLIKKKKENLKLGRFPIWGYLISQFCGFELFAGSKFRENGKKSRKSQNLIPLK